MLYLTLKLFFLAERKGDIGKAAYKTTAFFQCIQNGESFTKQSFLGFLDDDKHSFWDPNIYHSYHFTI